MRSFLVLGMFVALLFTFSFIIVNGVDFDICFCLHKMKLKKLNKMFCLIHNMAATNEF
jgi:hypothetical protein